MVRFLGAFVLSLMISNWIYAEFLLFVPQAQPYISRSMSFLSIPTHNEWSSIANAPGAESLGDEIRTYIVDTPLQVLMSAAGIADQKVQQTLKGTRTGSLWSGNSSLKEQGKPFLSGSDMFLEASESLDVFGGYERFMF